MVKLNDDKTKFLVLAGPCRDCSDYPSLSGRHRHFYSGPVHMGRSYLDYRENISTSLQATSRLVIK